MDNIYRFVYTVKNVYRVHKMYVQSARNVCIGVEKAQWLDRQSSEGGQSSVRRQLWGKSCSETSWFSAWERGCHRHCFSWTSSMAGSEVLVMCWVVFITLCSALRSATEQFPYQTVVQLVRILSIAQR